MLPLPKTLEDLQSDVEPVWYVPPPAPEPIWDEPGAPVSTEQLVAGDDDAAPDTERSPASLGPPKTRHAKVQIYISNDRINAELDMEAARLQRSRSWLLERAWKLARKRIKATPGG